MCASSMLAGAATLLRADWLAWNATMLPEVPESNTGGNTGATWADHIGSRPTTVPDNPAPDESSH